MQAAMLQIKARCGEMVEKARALYGMDLSQVRISFNMRGRAAGRASGRGYRMPGSAYEVKFNRDMLTRDAFEHVIQDTVPHEYAHVICYMNPDLGKNHDYGWARVCRAMGGSGARTHNEEVVFGKGITYEYTTDRGHKVRLSEKRHRYIQQGGRLTYKRGMGAVTQACAHSVVGVRGQTLAAPIVRKAVADLPPNAPAVIEAAVRMPPPAPVVRPVVTPHVPVARATSGASKADTARAIMLSGYRAGHSSEQIIAAIMVANGHDKRLATSYYKNNCTRVGIPGDYQ
jgi:predicted SprT family Zn-dependent metalloprotease